MLAYGTCQTDIETDYMIKIFGQSCLIELEAVAISSRVRILAEYVRRYNKLGLFNTEESSTNTMSRISYYFAARTEMCLKDLIIAFVIAIEIKKTKPNISYTSLVWLHSLSCFRM
jgi:hypothetical protein